MNAADTLEALACKASCNRQTKASTRWGVFKKIGLTANGVLC